MEIRKNISFVILKINTYDLSKITYLKILTYETVETIKINTSLNRFKFTHLLKPNYIITADLIKTRKNWILSEITNFRSFVTLEKFVDFEHFINLINILYGYLKEGADYDGFLREIEIFLNTKPKIFDLNINDFDEFVLQNLGFIEGDIREGKDANHM